MTKPDHQTWLQARHAKMATPPELIEQYIHKGTGSTPASSKRLVIGQMNEVYDVVTADEQNIIVRISHEADPRFEAERWAINAAREHGVPTPKVLLVEHAKHGGQEMVFCIEEKLPGVPLDELLKQKPVDELGVSVEQIGQVLAGIHSVKVEGFGYLQPDGKGWDIPFVHVMLDLNEKQDELRKAAIQWDVPQKEVDEGLKLLNAHKELYEWDDSRLVHGDFVAGHILVDKSTVTGVIDFQECSGNHPVFDFVHWYSNNHLFKCPISLEALMAAYPNKALFDGTFERLFHLVLLRRSNVSHWFSTLCAH